MANRRNGIVESEWVYTGAGFALSHPLARRFGAIWLVILWVAAQVMLQCYFLTDLPFPYFRFPLLTVAVIIALILNGIFALAMLIGRHPLAWYPVWLSLIAGFPLSLPLIMYWAEGQRPNLIYRHRFGRLVDPMKQGDGT